jgi:hypothetical protein
MLFSSLVSGITAISFLPKIAGSGTQEANFYEAAIPIFIAFSLISLAEWFLLGRSRKMKGPYGITLAVEVIKTVALGMGASQYSRSVDGGSADFLLLQLITFAIIFMIALTKVARTKIDEIASRDISRTFLNLLPTILVLLLFMGTYFTEIAGLGTPRQKREFDTYTEKEIDWALFNTPTWDATYLLENLLDQFTAGLSAPDVPLFNVTSDQANPQEPPAYWRLSNLDTYEYTNKPPYSTDWNPSTSIKRTLSPVPSTPNSTYSNIVPAGDRTARFTVRLPLDLNASTADVTIHPSFTNILPTTWNGLLGSYVSSNSFELYDSTGSQLTPITNQAQEVFPIAYADDLFGIYADLEVSETSSEAGHFDYTMDYKAPDIQTVAAFSLTREESEYLKCLDPVTWSTIKAKYLQIPSVIPDNPVVGGQAITPVYDNYTGWAPYVAGNASAWNDPLTTVFGQAYANMLKFGNQTNFEFDTNMWLSNQVAPGVDMDRPAEYEDYNEWFMRRDGGGVSLHFASTYAMINRLQGLPTRVVIGYLAGNDTFEPTRTWRVVTSRFLHAWAEVLIPVDPNPLIPGDERVEWMSFDPLISQLAEQYGFDLPTDVIPSSSAEQTVFIRPDYDLETNGLAAAYAQHAIQPNDWILGRATVNYSGLTPSPYTLHHGDYITVSTRLISVPSLSTWLPYPEGTSISFYWASLEENSSETIEDNGTLLGTRLTDSRGVVNISLTVDIGVFSWRTANFYAIINLTGDVQRVALSLAYISEL